MVPLFAGSSSRACGPGVTSEAAVLSALEDFSPSLQSEPTAAPEFA